MSLEAITHVWKHSAQEGGNLLVMLALADYANDLGESYPATATLARKARLSERQTQRVLRSLEEAGEIVVLKNQGRNGTNLYRILGLQGSLEGGVKMSPRQNVGGDIQGQKGVTPTSPKPSLEPSIGVGGAGEATSKPSKLPASPMAKRLAGLYHRRLTTEWSDKEIKAFKKLRLDLDVDGEDLGLIEEYYEAERAKGADGNHRRDLLTFLNNYPGELDRARAWKANPSTHVRHRSNRQAPTQSPGNAGTSNAAVAGLY